MQHFYYNRKPPPFLKRRTSMSIANYNIAKAITLLSEVISADAALIPPRTLDVFGNEVDEEEEETVTAAEYSVLCSEAEDFSNDITDALDLLKDEIEQILEDQTDDDQLDDEFSQPDWDSTEDDADETGTTIADSDAETSGTDSDVKT